MTLTTPGGVELEDADALDEDAALTLNLTVHIDNGSTNDTNPDSALELATDGPFQDHVFSTPASLPPPQLGTNMIINNNVPCAYLGCMLWKPGKGRGSVCDVHFSDVPRTCS